MKISITKRFCLLMALTLGTMLSASAQETEDSIWIDSVALESKIDIVPEGKHKLKLQRWGVCIEGSFLHNGYTNYDVVDWGIQGCYRFNTNFSVGVGLLLMYAQEYSTYWQEGNYSYHYAKDLDEDSHFRKQVDIVLSASYILPVLKRSGIVLGGATTFCPVPLESFDVSRTPLYSSNNSNPMDAFLFRERNKEIKSKSVYDAFQPGVFAETGIYHDLNEYGIKYRLSITYGIGLFDMFRGSRHTKVFDQKLKDYLPDERPYHRVTLRLTIFE